MSKTGLSNYLPFISVSVSIERADWPKLHDILKGARDATTRQCQILASVCAFVCHPSSFIRDAVTVIDTGHVITAKQAMSTY